MQKQGFPYIKQMLVVGVVAGKEWGESRAAQVMLTLRDPGTEESHLSVDGTDHKNGLKSQQREGWKKKLCLWLPTKGKRNGCRTAKATVPSAAYSPVKAKC